MKVFISWSGKLSREIAELLKKNIPAIIQQVDVFLSSEDIEKGNNWDRVLSNELSNSNYGIICLTKENVNKPWIHFEAGALAKHLDAKLFVLMIDVQVSDISGPLSRYQATKLEKDDFRKLIDSINKELETSLPKERLETIYNPMWESIQNEIDLVFAGIEQQDTPELNNNSDRDVLEEVLRISRQMSVSVESVSDQLFYLTRNESSDLHDKRPERQYAFQVSNVCSVEEFARSILSHSIIVFEKEEYCTTEIQHNNTHVFHDKVFDGKQLVIERINHLAMYGNGSTLTTRPRYAQVVLFNNCRNIVVDGFTMGHTEEPGTCMGNVIQFQNCSDVYLCNLKLFGCGTYGIRLINCKNVYIDNVEIYDCTYGALAYSNTECLMNNTKIYNCNNSFDIIRLDNSILVMNNSSIYSNKNVNRLISKTNSQFYYKNLDCSDNSFLDDGGEFPEGISLDAL